MTAGSKSKRADRQVPGRTLTKWLPPPGGITTDIGNQRTVTDTTAPASPKKYYRVEIAK